MEKWIQNVFLKDMRKIIDEYSMIEKGDKIMLAVSGGKDSLIMMYGINLLCKYKIYDFTYKVIIVDNGYLDKTDNLEVFLNDNQINYEIIVDRYAEEIVKNNEKSVCYTCARLRKGILKRLSIEGDFNKIALGHTKDDLAETFFMNLFTNGKLAAIAPVRSDIETNIKLIRPLLYIDEKDIIKAIDLLSIPIVKSTCEYGKINLRKDTDEFVSSLEEKIPDLKDKIVSGLKNVRVEW